MTRGEIKFLLMVYLFSSIPIHAHTAIIQLRFDLKEINKIRKYKILLTSNTSSIFERSLNSINLYLSLIYILIIFSTIYWAITK